MATTVMATEKIDIYMRKCSNLLTRKVDQTVKYLQPVCGESLLLRKQNFPYLAHLKHREWLTLPPVNSRFQIK